VSAYPADDVTAQARVHAPCPSCSARQIGCFTREGEIGSWCCGDCTAHSGNHDWEGVK